MSGWNQIDLGDYAAAICDHMLALPKYQSRQVISWKQLCRYLAEEYDVRLDDGYGYFVSFDDVNFVKFILTFGKT